MLTGKQDRIFPLETLLLAYHILSELHVYFFFLGFLFLVLFPCRLKGRGTLLSFCPSHVINDRMEGQMRGGERKRRKFNMHRDSGNILSCRRKSKSHPPVQVVESRSFSAC